MLTNFSDLVPFYTGQVWKIYNKLKGIMILFLQSFSDVEITHWVQSLLKEGLYGSLWNMLT